MPGPAPKPGARRPNNGRDNNPFHQSLALPSEGRRGRAPKWPISKMKAGEKAAWSGLWATPQAVAWEKLGWTRVVARYCRLMVIAEGDDAPVPIYAEVRQLEDRLGLTPKAMLSLRWSIVEDEVAEKREEKPARRLRVVDPKLAASG